MNYAKFLICVLVGLFALPGVSAYLICNDEVSIVSITDINQTINDELVYVEDIIRYAEDSCGYIAHEIGFGAVVDMDGYTFVNFRFNVWIDGVQIMQKSYIVWSTGDVPYIYYKVPLQSGSHTYRTEFLANYLNELGGAYVTVLNDTEDYVLVYMPSFPDISINVPSSGAIVGEVFDVHATVTESVNGIDSVYVRIREASDSCVEDFEGYEMSSPSGDVYARAVDVLNGGDLVGILVDGGQYRVCVYGVSGVGVSSSSSVVVTYEGQMKISGFVQNQDTRIGIPGVYVSYQSDVVVDLPVSYWLFDGVSGSNILDTVGNNDGVLYGGFRTSGFSGNGVDFDGVNDYVNLGNPSDLNFDDDRFTFSAWVKVDPSDYWYSESVIASGLGTVGGESSFTVFRKDSTLYGIAGGETGTFTGFNWTGSAWQSDSVIVSGLPDVGGESTIAIFEKDGTWYGISGEFGGDVYGFNWTGSTWQSDSAIKSGLNHVVSPVVFQKDGTWYLINGDSFGGDFTGFNWTGSTWQSDTAIVSGLPNGMLETAPTVYEKYGMLYLITGVNDGYFVGYNWTGSTWQSDTAIVSGLGNVGNDSTPIVFQMDGALYMISGEDDGVFNGYSASRVIYSTGIDSSSSGFEVTVEGNSFEVHLKEEGSSNPLITLYDPASIDDGNWHHVAFVRDIYSGWYNGTNMFFVDGQLVDQNNVLFDVDLGNANDNFIGAGSVGVSRYFDGTIDSVRIYGYGLSISQIESLYESLETVYKSDFTWTVSGGYFEFFDIASGIYNLEFAMTGYETDFLRVDIPPSSVRNIVYLQRLSGGYDIGNATIVVRVIDETGVIFPQIGICSIMVITDGYAENVRNVSIHTFTGLDASKLYLVQVACDTYHLSEQYNVSTGSVVTVVVSRGVIYSINFLITNQNGNAFEGSRVLMSGAAIDFECITNRYGRCSVSVPGDRYRIKVSGDNHYGYSEEYYIDSNRVDGTEIHISLLAVVPVSGLPELTDEEIKSKLRQDLTFLWTLVVLAVTMTLFRYMGGRT